MRTERIHRGGGHYPRIYSEADLTLYAESQHFREGHQPASCHKGDRCWLLLGPPGCTSHAARGTRCLGCDGVIK